MGKELAEAYPEAREVFATADRVLGFPLSRLCFEGPLEELTLTENTQPALLAVSVAVFRVLESRGARPNFVAGHSLGEYSALVAAGGLEFEEALRLVRSRGRFMQEAVPVGVGAMAAIIGLELDQVHRICGEAAQGQVVSPANQNAPDQVAIAGHTEAVQRASELAMARGAKRVIPLPVSAPFHCSLMQPAQDRMRPLLEAADFRDLRFTLVNNVDARPIRTAAEARDGLVRQISSMVCWTESVRRMAAAGVDTFVEVGAGKVLAGLIRRIEPSAVLRSLEKPAQVEDYVQTG
jgi:[acyl-carrier-protein] S-malonyltransferase